MSTQPAVERSATPTPATDVGIPGYVAPVFVPLPAIQPEPAAPAGFGETTDGLTGANAELSIVRGLSGKAVRVTGSAGERFGFVAAKKLVTAKAGAPYKARAYVRTLSPGMLVCLRAEELGGGETRTTERCSPVRSGWKRFSVHGAASGRKHRVTFSIRVLSPGGGTSFDVDGFKLG